MGVGLVLAALALCACASESGPERPPPEEHALDELSIGGEVRSVADETADIGRAYLTGVARRSEALVRLSHLDGRARRAEDDVRRRLDAPAPQQHELLEAAHDAVRAAVHLHDHVDTGAPAQLELARGALRGVDEALDPVAAGVGRVLPSPYDNRIERLREPITPLPDRAVAAR